MGAVAAAADDAAGEPRRDRAFSSASALSRRGEVVPGTLASLENTLPPTPLKDLLAADGASVYVFSSDPDLVDAVQKAGGEQYPVVALDEWSVLMASVANGRTRIVLLDAETVPGSMADALDELHAASQSLVVLAAARRDEAQSMMGLLSDRQIHRLLIKPAALGITRLLLESAVARYLQLRESPEHMPELREEPRRRRRQPARRPALAWAAAAGAVLVAGAAAVVGIGGLPMPWGGGSPPQRSVATPPVAANGAGRAGTATNADEAGRAGETVAGADANADGAGPAGGAAAEAVADAGTPADSISAAPDAAAGAAAAATGAGETAAAAAAPGADDARAAGADTGADDTLLAEAEARADAGNGSRPPTEAAARAGDAGASRSPTEAAAGARAADAPRSPTEAAAGVRAADAARSPTDSGPQLPANADGSGTPEAVRAADASSSAAVDASSPAAGDADVALAAADAPIADPLIATELQGYLTLARTRLQQDRLLAPSGDSARDYLDRAAALNESDPDVVRLRAELAAALVATARIALDIGSLDQAAAFAAEAARAGADPEALALLRIDLDGARAARDEERRARLLADGVRRLEAGRLIGPADDSALNDLAALRAEAPDYPGLEEPWQQLQQRLTAEVRRAIGAEDWQAAARITSALEAAGGAPELAASL
ncbi:MAG: hypothetical protein JXB36_04980, partial [Gammaproteobacteria bacterium]|nr:hypothetical protein [Gammaproteobacteria bacterium]